MRADCLPLFERLKARLSSLGYMRVREEELSAKFVLTSGWNLLFECERYYGPAFQITLVPPQRDAKGSEGYVLWLLMKAFENLNHVNYGAPTIDAQVDFLTSEREKIFNNPSSYDTEYRRLNSEVK
jgi:hypothetical protein